MKYSLYQVKIESIKDFGFRPFHMLNKEPEALHYDLVYQGDIDRDTDIESIRVLEEF